MKTDIILCGVGGQGILSIATIIGEAAMKENLYIKQAEVHGMSQRGVVQMSSSLWSLWRHCAICHSSQKMDGLSHRAHLSLISPTILIWQPSRPTSTSCPM